MSYRPLILALALATGFSAPGLAGEPHRRLVINGDCPSCNYFADSNLAGAQIVGGDFSGANFSDSQLLGAQLVDLNLSGANFADAILTEARLSNVQLDGANLHDAQMVRLRVHQASLRGANLRDANMEGGVFLLSDFRGATLHSANLAHTIFRQTDFSQSDLRDANLMRAHFYGARLRGADVRGAMIRDVIFENTDLSSADLRGAHIANTQFISVNLSSTDMRDVEGLTAENFRHVCGDEHTRLPFDYTLTRCSEDGSLVFTLRRSSETEIAAPVASLETQRAALERASAELEAAIIDSGQITRIREREMALAMREALTELRQAAEEVTVRINESESSDSVDMAIEQATAEVLRDSLRVAARALAEAQVNGDLDQVDWSFDFNPTELGDRIRLILEQSGPAPKPVAAPMPLDGAAPEPSKQPTPLSQAEPAQVRRIEQAEEQARRQQEAAQRAEERAEERRREREARNEPPQPPQPPRPPEDNEG